MIISNLSEGENNFVKSGCILNVRLDGRTRSDFRAYYMSLGKINLANGSCSIRIEGNPNEILTGLKLEISDFEPSKKLENFFNLTINCSQKKSGFYYDYNDKSNDSNNSIKEIIYENLLKNINTDQLIIISNKKCWKINIDIFVIGILDFSLIEGAFFNLEIPKIKILHNQITDEDEIELENDNLNSTFKFNLEKFPLICVIGEIQNLLCVDLTSDELAICDTFYIVSIDENQTIFSFSKFG